MKYLSLLTAIVLLGSCLKKSTITFTGTAPGIASGVFVIKTTGDSTVYGENIKDGKFTLKPKTLKYPGYYLMNITEDNKDDNHSPFEVFLEAGTYNVETETGKLYKYPKITSTSKIQNELSAFYRMEDELNLKSEQETKVLSDEVSKSGASMSKTAYNALLNKLSAAQAGTNNNNITAFKAFIKKYPDSEISAHIMSKLNYEDDPVAYAALYQSLSPAARNSDDGKDIGEKLNHLVKLTEGATAPAIAGKTSSGKLFDYKTINKKLILIDFWRASNDISRRNHQQIMDMLSAGENKKILGVVSVSFDTKENWWLDAISQDNMPWTQVIDLKGDDSPNAANWNITQIPTYYLLDKDWKIVRRNIDISKVSLEVNEYLKTHR